VIGMKKDLVVNKILNTMPVRFEPATGDDRLCAAVIVCDEKTGERGTSSDLCRVSQSGNGGDPDADFPHNIELGNPFVHRSTCDLPPIRANHSFADRK
jgi:hypothetical protein